MRFAGLATVIPLSFYELKKRPTTFASQEDGVPCEPTLPI